MIQDVSEGEEIKPAMHSSLYANIYKKIKRTIDVYGFGFLVFYKCWILCYFLLQQVLDIILCLKTFQYTVKLL